MAYNKKTWVTNEIITTAALNNIENGIESLDNDLSSLSLGIHTDGLIYLYKNNIPMGEGIDYLQAEGNMLGYVNMYNDIVLTADLPNDTYTLKYENEDGTFTSICDLVINK